MRYEASRRQANRKRPATGAGIDFSGKRLKNSRMSESQRKFEVIVIGAGISGLTAARDLGIDGYDVLVLEAGIASSRIWTSWELGLPIDLGASWIHGFEDNPDRPTGPAARHRHPAHGYFQCDPRALSISRPV